MSFLAFIFGWIRNKLEKGIKMCIIVQETKYVFL